MAAFFGTYIDDIRTGAANERNCRETTRRIALWANYFGQQQDAARKRRQPARRPGAWTGAMCFSNDDGLFVTCTKKKWGSKGKAIVQKWLDELGSGKAELLEHKSLERDVGFLVHLSRTFPGMAPYLKGFYNIMNSWRMGRNEDSWKYSMGEWKSYLGMEESMRSADVDLERKEAVRKNQGDQPKMVSPVPRLLKDSMRTARFGFGDASGAGFGSSWSVKGSIKYRNGTWGPDMEVSSSNLRELKNLVDTLKLMAK